MYSETDIIATAWLVKEVVNLILGPEKLSVNKILLVGSYASGKADIHSDIDFLVELKGLRLFPKDTWQSLKDINLKLNKSKVHIIFGTVEAAESLYQKNKDNKKSYKYREISLTGELNAATHKEN